MWYPKMPENRVFLKTAYPVTNLIVKRIPILIGLRVVLLEELITSASDQL